MKWLLLSLITVYSCGTNSSASFSPDQQGLFVLCDEFRKDYKETHDSITRKKLIGNYEIKLQQYLKYTCDSSLKNIKVRMTKLEEDPNGTIRAEFMDSNCSYVFHQAYDSSSQMKADVVYRFVRSLKKDTEMTLRFLFGGNVEISDPETTSQYSFKIDVIPVLVMG